MGLVLVPDSPQHTDCHLFSPLVCIFHHDRDRTKRHRFKQGDLAEAVWMLFDALSGLWPRRYRAYGQQPRNVRHQQCKKYER